MDGTVADDRTDCTGVDWIVEAGTDDDEDGTEDGGNRRRRSRHRRLGTGRTPGLGTIPGHVTRLLAAQPQTRERAVPRQVTGFMTDRTRNRLTSMQNTHRKVKQ